MITVYIASALYLVTALAFYLTQRIFYKSKNGKLRVSLIWLFRALTFGLVVRGVHILLPSEFKHNYGGEVGIIIIITIAIASWSFCIYMRKKYL